MSGSPVKNSGSPDTTRVVAIDALRGLAALGVMFYHYVGLIGSRNVPVSKVGGFFCKLAGYGYLGVPVFFVLSGYVIAMTAARYSFDPRTGSRFLLRRLVRLAPPYWALVLLTFITILTGNSLGFFKTTTVTTAQLSAHLIYGQNLLGFPSLDVAYWTLCLEVQFYLVFCVLSVIGYLYGSRARIALLTTLTIGSFLIEWFNLV